MRWPRWLAGAVALCAISAPPVLARSSTPERPHVFVIVLENKTYEVTFGADSPAPYLAETLPAQGALLRQYYGTGHVSLDNYISMVSGQAPNPQTQSDCQFFTDFVSLTGGALDGNGQAVGTGCVYPANVRTVADQLESAGFTWKGYMEDMGTPCRHPAVNSRDETQSAKVGDQYAARHNPFVYFHSIIDDPARCAAHVVDLKALPADLASEKTTPAFSFISPNLCNDGHDAPCVDGKPGGLVSADAFLQEWVPRITSSPAFAKNGVLIVTFDEAEVGDAATDTRACCHEPTGPNTLMPGIVGPGGGRTGTVVLGPKIRPGTVSDEPYNHYSLLRTFEDLFGLTHLGFAGQAGLRAFGGDVFTGG
ncbi:MAG TPA: alkaline phosphatase family protein [Acidimicrobiales bacterium]|nr:alkaline phosphatase family protein [Acidimicrobiales bacterium]